MPGPFGQDCSCPSDITPARDGPAHKYPDDGVARADRTSQYNAPSGVMKPVCRLTDRLPDPPQVIWGGSHKSREALKEEEEESVNSHIYIII